MANSDAWSLLEAWWSHPGSGWQFDPPNRKKPSGDWWVNLSKSEWACEHARIAINLSKRSRWVQAYASVSLYNCEVVHEGSQFLVNLNEMAQWPEFPNGGYIDQTDDLLLIGKIPTVIADMLTGVNGVLRSQCLDSRVRLFNRTIEEWGIIDTSGVPLTNNGHVACLKNYNPMNNSWTKVLQREAPENFDLTIEYDPRDGSVLGSSLVRRSRE